MPRWADDDESWEDDSVEPPDYGDDDDAETETCPHCHRPIHEDVQRCPYCNQYLSTLDAPRSHKLWWVLIGVVICVYLGTKWLL
jgi:hypothetical protein